MGRVGGGKGGCALTRPLNSMGCKVSCARSEFHSCTLSFIISVATSDSYEIIKSKTCKGFQFKLKQLTDDDICILFREDLLHPSVSFYLTPLKLLGPPPHAFNMDFYLAFALSVITARRLR